MLLHLNISSDVEPKDDGSDVYHKSNIFLLSYTTTVYAYNYRFATNLKPKSDR